MNRANIWHDIELALREEKKSRANWPDHIAAQAGIVSEQSGSLMHASLHWKYERSESTELEKMQIAQIKIEALKVAVTAIRFLENLKESNDSSTGS